MLLFIYITMWFYQKIRATLTKLRCILFRFAKNRGILQKIKILDFLVI